MNLKYYYSAHPAIWTGSIDHPTDLAWFRQAVPQVSVEDILVISNKSDKTLFCILEFSCDESVRRNMGRVGAAEGPFNI